MTVAVLDLDRHILAARIAHGALMHIGCVRRIDEIVGQVQVIGRQKSA